MTEPMFTIRFKNHEGEVFTPPAASLKNEEITEVYYDRQQTIANTPYGQMELKMDMSYYSFLYNNRLDAEVTFRDGRGISFQCDLYRAKNETDDTGFEDVVLNIVSPPITTEPLTS